MSSRYGVEIVDHPFKCPPGPAPMALLILVRQHRSGCAGVGAVTVKRLVLS